jgi:arginine decarboxylase
MAKLDQSKTPYVDALKKYVSDDVSPFDVPGHHMGNITNAATELFGHELYRCDVNAPLGLDNLAKPTGVILESERYLADACGADEAFFLIDGTSSGIIAMILTAVKAGEKIILPRNVHKSIINGLILSGAVPVYVMPEIDNELEIANQPSLDDWKKAILRNPSAKAVFVINPTYFGAVGPLQEIVNFAHEHHMAVLCDEAHGAHYYFNCPDCPLSAMAAGADMSSASFHKTVGSLTQSSVLLMHTKLFSREDVQKSLNIINTTSPSGILIASIDAARSYMASQEGSEAMSRTYELAAYARQQIHQIPGFIDEGKEHFLEHGCYNYDESKLVIGIDKLDIDGFQLYHLLKEKYDVMMELCETYAVLGIFAIGTKKEHVDHLINALKEISHDHYHPETVYPDHHFDNSFPYHAFTSAGGFPRPGQSGAGGAVRWCDLQRTGHDVSARNSFDCSGRSLEQRTRRTG